MMRFNRGQLAYPLSRIIHTKVIGPPYSFCYCEPAKGGRSNDTRKKTHNDKNKKM